jgi:hypothetical protein
VDAKAVDNANDGEYERESNVRSRTEVDMVKTGGHIVLTSIQAPTRQVEAFLRQPAWKTVFVADLKTPEFRSSNQIHFLSVDAQKTAPGGLGQALPWNHYARKNLGYLHAIEQGCECIFDTDDDNQPIDPWRPRPPAACVQAVACGQKWINVYAHFGGTQVWPRGFPLEYIGICEAPCVEPSEARNVMVWQGLVAGDPDVDAIFRLTRPGTVEFVPAPPLILPFGSYCPFNSQNTLWDQPAFPYLYLPSTVSFRFTDILRGLVAQRCFWAHGWRLGFQSVTALQERNPHSLLADFKDELPCYLHSSHVAEILDGLELSGDASTNLRVCYGALCRAGLVQSAEMSLLDLWLEAFSIRCPARSSKT